MTKIKYCAFDKDRRCNEYCMAYTKEVELSINCYNDIRREDVYYCKRLGR
jgi:hypothetical protein